MTSADLPKKRELHCPECGSHHLRKLRVLNSKVEWGPFQTPVNCPFRECCVNADSWRCQFCYRKGTHITHTDAGTFTNPFENYCQFKDKEYYRKTVPFIEIKRVFENKKGRAQHG